LTEGINNIHKEFDINRTQWQILNSINENDDINRNQIIVLLSEFLDKEAISSTIANLINRDLVAEETKLTLTEKGENVFKKCFLKQKEFRQKAMEGVTEQEYLQTITTLEKIIENFK